MKKIIVCLLVLCTGALGLLSLASAAETAAADSPLTLEECFQLALKQSETIAVNQEKIKEAEGRFKQALGTILPHISFAVDKTWEDTDSYPALNKTGTDQRFVFKQTLFAGFKELAGMSGSRSEIKQRRWETKRARELLFVDVADAFYLLIEIQEDLKAMEATRKALTDRIADLNSRVNIGKSRPSEIASTELQLYTIAADMETVKGRLAITRELLEFLVGRPVPDLRDVTTDITLGTQESYLANVADRADVRAADYARQTARKNAYVAKAGFMPNVSIGGNYYTQRDSAPRNGEWDALLSVSVPIFEGTETIGAAQEAGAQARASELSYQRVQRAALQDIRASYSLVAAAQARTGALRLALQAAEQNYALQKEDYRINLVNNLDVLDAIQTLENTRRNFNTAFYAGHRFYWQLRAAGGDVPGTDDQ